MDNNNMELFGESESGSDDDEELWDPPAASRSCPAIEGLHLTTASIPENLASTLVEQLLPYFHARSDQVMLFGAGTDGLPPFINSLISTLSGLLQSQLSPSTHKLLFPQIPADMLYPARQVIFNLYRPGDGISPHIDLLGRFGDGIIIVSLISGIVMQFSREEEDALLSVGPLSLWLPSRSILVLEKEARYAWKHGIPPRKQDFVEEVEGTDTGAAGLIVALGSALLFAGFFLVPK
ncbi:hypothetical protein BS47DRAFT_1360043 [Hydnum rufescens UP504]|uniref:Fe2OG dioxygenase domain-containing protein n=1 Tax=Hydnum rufescens UP504 TaxID=1448309 RepID=A0A9P6DVV5_9AGAM|nr:hypothetical protein BS47DRAFT_1360043 [Hydnum rufescens UP504]